MISEQADDEIVAQFTGLLQKVNVAHVKEIEGTNYNIKNKERVSDNMNKAVYTTTPVAGSWAGAVMTWAGAVMSWAGAVMSWTGAVMSWAEAVLSIKYSYLNFSTFKLLKTQKK